MVKSTPRISERNDDKQTAISISDDIFNNTMIAMNHKCKENGQMEIISRIVPTAIYDDTSIFGENRTIVKFKAQESLEGVWSTVARRELRTELHAGDIQKALKDNGFRTPEQKDSPRKQSVEIAYSAMRMLFP